MENVVLILGTLVAIAFVFALIVMVIQPFWAIIDCAITPEFGTGKKILWIVLCFFFYWMFMNLIYGAIVSRSRALRRVTRFTVVVLVLSTIALYYFYYNNETFRQAFDQQMIEAEMEVESTDSGYGGYNTTIPESDLKDPDDLEAQLQELQGKLKQLEELENQHKQANEEGF